MKNNKEKGMLYVKHTLFYGQLVPRVFMMTDMRGQKKCLLILQMPVSHQTEQFNSTMKIYGIFNITK